MDLDLSDETIETLFLAAYLNLKLVAEIIEAQQKDGKVYFNVGGIASLLESPVPEDGKKWATAEWLAKTYPAKFQYLDKLQALAIEGEGELPIEKRLERERIHKYLSAGEPLGDLRELKFDYHLFQTCNHWVASLLRAAGVPASGVPGTFSVTLMAELRWRSGGIFIPHSYRY